jgi:hypothetical protein
MNVVPLREDSEYKAEYILPTMYRTNKGDSILYSPQMIRVLRKITVTNQTSGRVYPKGSYFFISCNPSIRLWGNSPYFQASSNFAGLQMGSTGTSILQSGRSPNTYYLAPVFLRGYYWVQMDVRYGGTIEGQKEEVIRNYNNLKLVICGHSEHYSGTREAWSGSCHVDVYDYSGSYQRTSLARSMHTWNSKSILAGNVPLSWLDYQRYKLILIRNEMNRGGKEGASCGLITWTTRYYDPEDFLSLGIRLN